MKKWIAIAAIGAVALTVAIVLAGTALAAGRGGMKELEASPGWGRGPVDRDEYIGDFDDPCAEGAGCRFSDEDGDDQGHVCGGENGECDCDGSEPLGRCYGREGRGEGRGVGEGCGRSNGEGCQLQ
jgi:hypothetical protein